MKTIIRLFTAVLITATFVASSVRAQVVSPGSETIDKVTMPGLSLTLPIDEKYIAKAWEDQLRSYGRVTTARGSVYRVAGANVPAIASEPINLTSQIKSSKNATTVFVSMDLGNQTFVNTGTPQYTATETMLKEFSNRMVYEQSVRDAENILVEAQKNQQNTVKKGEKLQRDTDNNRKDKDKLLKRIDENAKEFEQLTKDIAANKTDQANALTDVTGKIKSLEDVKAKKQ